MTFKGSPIPDSFNKRRDGRVAVPGHRDIGTPSNPIKAPVNVSKPKQVKATPIAASKPKPAAPPQVKASPILQAKRTGVGIVRNPRVNFKPVDLKNKIKKA